VLVLLSAVACARKPVVEMVKGDCGAVHGADVCAWGETTDGAVTSFGATIPIAAIDNAPDDAEMVWPPVAEATIALPEAVHTATGFQLVTVYWEPHGHPPGPYLTPHFDFHFYATPMSEISAIDCADATKPAELPAGYELPDVEIPGLGNLVGICVPLMGMHSLPGEQLKSETLFEKVMVVGYYHGAPNFVEPMLTREMLLKRQSFDLAVPEVPGRPASARYPMKFRADYDSTAQAYRFVFSDLESAKPTP
jgi:hypothetical protein